MEGSFLWIVELAVGGLLLLLLAAYFFSNGGSDKNNGQSSGNRKRQGKAGTSSGRKKKDSSHSQAKGTTKRVPQEPKSKTAVPASRQDNTKEVPPTTGKPDLPVEDEEKKKREVEKKKQKKQRRKTILKEQKKRKEEQHYHDGSHDEGDEEADKDTNSNLQQSEKLGSSDSLSDFEKIDVPKEEDITDGWELVTKKPKKKPEEESKDDSAKVETEGDETHKVRERRDKDRRKKERDPTRNREGNAKGSAAGGKDREQRGTKKGHEQNRNKRGNQKLSPTKEPSQNKPTRPSASTRRPWRDGDTQVNGVLFSKYRIIELDEETEEPVEEEKEKWDHLSEVVKSSSTSADAAPLQSVVLEMRCYKRVSPVKLAGEKRQEAKPKSKSETWAAMAKYNYTQVPPNRPAEDRDKGKEREEVDEGIASFEEEEVADAKVHTVPPPEVAADKQPDPHTADLIESFLKALGPPYVSQLVKADLVAGKPKRFLVRVSNEQMKVRLSQLLRKKVSSEAPHLRTPEAVTEFLADLCGELGGKDATFSCFTNVVHEEGEEGRETTLATGVPLWKKGHDEGFFMVSHDKVVMLWFI